RCGRRPSPTSRRGRAHGGRGGRAGTSSARRWPCAISASRSTSTAAARTSSFHHECEIAQAEAVTHKPFARYWVHNGFVNMGKDKMSKSLGNTLTIRDIVKRHDPEALRLWILGTHYRHLLEWSDERVEEAARALARLTRVVDDAASLGAPAAAVPAAFAGFAARFTAAMDDDFNPPQA